VCIALAGVVAVTLFVQWSDLQVGGTMAAGPFPPLAACLLWALLLGANAIIGRARFRRFALSGPELLVILGVWVAANMVAGRGMLHPLLASLTGPAYYARSATVKGAVAQNLPDWLAVTDKDAARRFYEGYGVPVPWGLWRRPLVTWGLFLVPFLTANVCLCGLFERVWVRQERLSYPLVALPLEMFHGHDARASGAVALRRSFAFGLAFPLLLHGLGVTHAYLPAVPCVPFYNDVSTLVTDPPWSAALPLYVNLYPLLVGLTFLAPTDVTFSVWFFLLLNKIELVVTAAAGWNDGVSGGVRSLPPYLEEQSAGAFLALAALIVWNARRHLRSVVRSLWSRYPAGYGYSVAEPSALPASEQGVSAGTDGASMGDRLLLLGFLGGLVGVLVWCVVTGLPFWFAFGFFGFYLAVALVLGRLMAEGGVSWILAPTLPDKLILALTGTAAVSPLVLTRLMLHVQHLRDTRQMLAPSVFQAGKLRDASGWGATRFYLLVLVAVILALGVGAARALPIFYHYGALSLAPNSDGLMMSASVVPTTAVNQLSARLLTPIRPAPASAVAVVAGLLVTCALSALRLRFPGWPLHPLGYALTGTLQLGYANKMIFSIFLGWAFKALTLRFGGSQGFRFLRFAALGLIVGDLLMGGILKLLDALLGPSGYAIF
jgi:hypothetical protein